MNVATIVSRRNVNTRLIKRPSMVEPSFSQAAMMREKVLVIGRWLWQWRALSSSAATNPIIHLQTTEKQILVRKCKWAAWKVEMQTRVEAILNLCLHERRRARLDHTRDPHHLQQLLGPLCAESAPSTSLRPFAASDPLAAWSVLGSFWAVKIKTTLINIKQLIHQNNFTINCWITWTRQNY